MQNTPFEQRLKAAGQSVTGARRSVFAALQGQEPLSMHELVERCTDIDRASIYRTIALFEQLDVVQRLQTGWKYKIELSDEFHEHHHHATCLSCGRSIVIHEDKTMEHYLTETVQKIGFKLTRHQIELQGICATCQTTTNIA